MTATVALLDTTQHDQYAAEVSYEILRVHEDVKLIYP